MLMKYVINNKNYKIIEIEKTVSLFKKKKEGIKLEQTVRNLIKWQKKGAGMESIRF